MGKLTIIGGTKNRKSSVIDKIYNSFIETNSFKYIELHNGKIIPKDISNSNLTIWMPDIANEEPKHYPVKKQGSVLICSKVIHNDRTRIDAITRIFRMHGNAVIAIRKIINNSFEFELIDALGNTWCRTIDILELVHTINSLYKWTKESVRKSLKHNELPDNVFNGVDYKELQIFMNINQLIALKVAEGCGNRFFGNYSTRCTKLFPSTRRNKNYFFFSPRNTDKRFVTIKDLVLTDNQYYYGNRKPSVDTPVQIELYQQMPKINWIIHGHAYIKNAPITEKYLPCGDMREVVEVHRVIRKINTNRINLKNHGFLLIGKNVEDMQNHLDDCNFHAL